MRERRFLRQYRSYHDHAPTFLGIAVPYFFSKYLILHMFLWSCAYFCFEDLRDLSFILIGISFGLIIRDTAVIYQFIRSWQLFDIILDWGQVEELLKFGSVPESETTQH